MNKKAFTLIEILVVVLIIGILAAIAVPQYQKAVAKAELRQIVSLTRSVKEAEELYYLANGKYAPIEDLDIDIKDSKVKCSLSSQNVFNCFNKNFIISYYFNNSSSPRWTECIVNSTDYNSALAFACQEFLNGQSENNVNPIGRLVDCSITFNSNGSQCRVFSGVANF